MISYQVPIIAPATDFPSALLAAIAEYDTAQNRRKAWPKRAAAALKKFLANPNDKPTALWSEIKPVYVRIQNGKCGFCERLLGEDEVAAYESDVEHFRPKKGVTKWPPSEPIGQSPYPDDLPETTGEGGGYRHLPYHELNYLAACKTCNTRCKANYFPIAEQHLFDSTTPQSLIKDEEPYLIYPLGDLDVDPETLITFIGCKAIPAKPKAKRHDWNRARISIAFFLLNDPAREDQLILERASRLDLLGYKISAFEQSDPISRDAAWNEVKAEGAASLPHANCVRSMIRLYIKDPPVALQQIQDARTYRRSKLNLEGWAAAVPSPIYASRHHEL